MYSRCTLDYTEDGKPWCSTKVIEGGFHSSGNFGSCAASCESDLNPNAPSSCQSSEISKPYARLNTTFPDSCTERLRKQNTPGGQTLSGHAAFTMPPGDWDVVVIQGQSQEPSFSPASIYNNQLQSTRTIVDKLRKSNPCVLPVFFQTWGRLNGDTGNCPYYSQVCTFDGMQDRLTESYNTFAYVNQPAVVAPAGEAFRLIRSRGYLYSGDGSHPSASGSYLAACTFLETIWGISCIGNSYKPITNADLLQNIAHQAVTSRRWAWPQPEGPPCPSCIG